MVILGFMWIYTCIDSQKALGESIHLAEIDSTVFFFLQNLANVMLLSLLHFETSLI
jgi:hypothetical protein